MAVDIKVGDLFCGFDELQCRIDEYSKANYVQLWMRDARTLEAATKRVPKKVTSVDVRLKYYSVKYCCIHGGQAFRPHGHGHRQTA
jgi:zinc finger SWIM domain-containing protein 3